jgi:hypothetical protein
MRNPLSSARGRTIVGLTLAVLFVPVLLGITACYELETPIGDPDHGWADPRISGAWLSGDPLPEEHSAMLWLFEAWDGKTWLVTLLDFDEVAVDESSPAGEPGMTATESGAAGAATADATAPPATVTEELVEEVAEDVEYDVERLALPPEEVARLLHTLTDEDLTEFASGGVFKGWLTSIGPYRYLVLEPRLGVSGDSGLEPTRWWVFRIVLKGSMIQLDVFDSERDDLAEVTSRGEAEAIIARHSPDPEFFQPFLFLQRVPPAALDDVGTIVENANLAIQ